MGRDWKIFKEHDRKRLDCLEQTLSRNMGVNDSASEDSEECEGAWQGKHLLSVLENTEAIENSWQKKHQKGSAGEGSSGNEEYVIKKVEKRGFFYIWWQGTQLNCVLKIYGIKICKL